MILRCNLNNSLMIEHARNVTRQTTHGAGAIPFRAAASFFDLLLRLCRNIIIVFARKEKPMNSIVHPLEKGDASAFTVRECRCGGVHVTCGNATIHLTRNEFMFFARLLHIEAGRLAASLLVPRPADRKRFVH